MDEQMIETPISLIFCLAINSNISIYNSSFENFQISNYFMEITNNESLPLMKKYSAIFENVFFSNITLVETNSVSLLNLENLAGFISFTNLLFRKIISFKNIIELSSINGDINLDYLIFEENFIVSEILDLRHAFNITIFSLVSNLNNYINNETAGGFMRLYNVLYRKFSKLNIVDSFSGTSTLGIKIIDDLSRNSSNNEIFNVFSL